MSTISSSIQAVGSAVARMGVELADGLFGVPRRGDLACRVACAKQSQHLVLALVARGALRPWSAAAGAVERVVFATAVPEDLVLDAPAAPRRAWSLAS